MKVEQNSIRHIGNSKYQMGIINETKVGDWYEIEFAFVSLEYFARWLLMLGNQVKVLEPELLKEKLKEIVKVLAEHHVKG